METYGPDGTDELMVFFIESDVTTTMADLMGNTAASMGDWITGTNHPIIDEAFISSQHQIGQYPTLIGICPDRKIKRLGQDDTQTIYNFATACPPATSGAPEISFYSDYSIGCGELDVKFQENSWPRATEWLWDFGDGNTSTEESPSHSYVVERNYTVTLTAANADGESVLVKEEVILIGNGAPYYNQKVGPDTKDIGTGRYFEGGHQALIFDATNDFVLSSVKVFSDKEGERRIVLIDGDGILINQRTVLIPEGEHRVDLEFFIPQGTDYRIGLYSDAYLFRNDGGVSYPYVIDDLVNIKESTASTAPLQYYYYFYDWDVREPGCQAISGIDEELINQLELFPNPAQDVLNIEGKNLDGAKLSVTNVMGQTVQVQSNNYNERITLDISVLNTGVYFVNINGQSYKFIKE